MEAVKRYRRQWRRWGPVMGYLLIGGAMMVIHQLCHEIFEAGSSKMFSLAFLYPLLGGVGVHLLLAVLIPDAGESEYDPIFLGLYNAGILLLTVNQAAAGFLEITGSPSSYTSLIAIIGWMLTAAGVIVLAMVARDVHGFGNSPRNNPENGKKD